MRLVGFVLLAVVYVLLSLNYGFVRVAVGLSMSAVTLWLGFSYFRAAGEAPPEAEQTEVGDGDLKYVCTVCGLELRVEVATTDKAPTHCREKMVPVTRSGLRPLPDA